MADNVRNSSGRSPTGAAGLTALVVRVEEKLSAMNEMSAERAKTTDAILAQQQIQQSQINGLVTDMAVLKTQHASFWKGVTVLLGFVSAIGAALGWIISQVAPFFHK